VAGDSPGVSFDDYFARPLHIFASCITELGIISGAITGNLLSGVLGSKIFNTVCALVMATRESS